ncbi:MAG: thioesterase domain-containing protein [Gammaproteobacteria bacterium]|nr:thioesterase domain-containing protein [Gammaproteobacteria bacterium]
MNKLVFSPDKWLATIKQNRQADIRIFCFPYAGGSASVFLDWSKSLPDFLEVHAIQLPGRANRVGEKPIVDMNALLMKLSLLLIKYIDRPYVFFGHSMGAMIAFELSKRMQRMFGCQPEFLFLSGHSPPMQRGRASLHKLSDEQFLNEIKRKNGTPAEVFNNDDLLQCILPVLKSDHELCEKYSFNDSTKTNAPLHIFGGNCDPSVTESTLRLWENFTTAGNFCFKSFPGDHFFLNKNQSETALLEEISSKLYEWKSGKEEK